MNRILALATVLSTAVSTACGAPDSEPPPVPEAAAESASRNFRGRIYERNFVFTTLTGDSTFLVPWLMSAETRPGGVQRQARGLLARGSSWDDFYDQRWETTPTRAPWRILPHGTLRLVVGDGDAVEGIIYSEGQRQLELELGGGILMEWTGTRGQTYRLFEGAAYLSDQRVPGMILDMSRVHEAGDSAQGDWAFLTSGDSLQMVIENPRALPPGTPGGYRAWARLDFRNLQWTEVTVDWAEVSAFQPSRQDIPVSWTLSSLGDSRLEGVLQVLSAEVRPGEGVGPLLPVDALFLVGGTVGVEGRSYPVQGLFRHTRP